MTDEKKPQILLVDDEEAICQDIARSLVREGFDVEYRTSGEKGLEFLAKNPHTDIVLLDINLGAGLRGTECLKIINKMYKHVQVIMHTGEKDLNTGVECMKSGAYDFTTKPFEKQVFLEKARGALEKKKLSLLEEKEKLTLITGMAEGVTHQINNRLCEFSMESGDIILDVADMMENNREYLDKNPEFKKTVENVMKTAEAISNNVRKTSNVISGIINYGRIKSNGTQLSSFKLKDLIENAVELLMINNKSEQMPIKIAPYNEDQEIYGIKSLLIEAVYGIMQNAYEAVLQREILLKADEKKTPSEITVSLTASPDSYVLQIKDNGIGMKEEDKNKIYAPYFTTKPSACPGIGAGLYVIRRIVEDDHKGKLLFESSYLNGTVFFIEIPREKKFNSILIVDDEEETVELLVKSLQRQGIKAIGARSGGEALELFRDNYPEYVILDIHLPDTNGDVVIKEMKKIHPSSKIYFVTGDNAMSEIKARELGASGVIAKPLLPSELLDKIHSRK
ncbi:MAG: response regulator [Endomicrobiales bacterium]|jgi:DNA-binding response OmpR family regulator